MLRREDRIETMMDVLRNFRDMSSSSDWGGKKDVSAGVLRKCLQLKLCSMSLPTSLFDLFEQLLHKGVTLFEKLLLEDVISLAVFYLRM